MVSLAYRIVGNFHIYNANFRMNLTDMNIKIRELKIRNFEIIKLQTYTWQVAISLRKICLTKDDLTCELDTYMYLPWLCAI